jgi:Holliday junction resolvase RusA-like endonuclease
VIRLAFVVLGEPVGKGRPRFNGTTGRAYTPKATSEYEHDICDRAAYAAVSQQWPRAFDAPCRVVIDAIFQRPKNRYRKADPVGRMPRESGRIDCDNCGKIVLDALQKAGVFRNDSCVVDLHVRLWWAAVDETPCVEIEVTTLEAEGEVAA